MLPVKYERIKFLVIALKNSVEIYAWAPKPYHKFMAFKVQKHKSAHYINTFRIIYQIWLKDIILLYNLM